MSLSSNLERNSAVSRDSFTSVVMSALGYNRKSNERGVERPIGPPAGQAREYDTLYGRLERRRETWEASRHARKCLPTVYASPPILPACTLVANRR